MTEQHYRIRIKQGEVEIEVEGDKEFVEKHIRELRGEVSKTVKESPLKEEVSTLETLKDVAQLEKLSLTEFYKQKRPSGHNETVLVFAYWLTKKESKEEFKPKDILSCYDEVRVPKPKNIHQHMIELASGKRAYLTKGSKKGFYRLTLTGEEFVEKELPRKSE